MPFFDSEMKTKSVKKKSKGHIKIKNQDNKKMSSFEKQLKAISVKRDSKIKSAPTSKLSANRDLRKKAIAVLRKQGQLDMNKKEESARLVF